MTGVDSAYAGDHVQSSHVPSTVLGTGDPGVKETVLAPTELTALEEDSAGLWEELQL